MAGRRARAYEDLRSDSGREKTSGIRPGILQMLFKGGPARQTAGMDTRHGRSEGVRPATRQMLFAGGKTRSLASEDLEMGAPGEGSDLPGNMQPLADGGEVEDGEVGDGLVVAAEDIMDCVGSYMGPSPSDSDSKVERASKEAARRARAKVLAQALKAFIRMADED